MRAKLKKLVGRLIVILGVACSFSLSGCGEIENGVQLFQMDFVVEESAQYQRLKQAYEEEPFNFKELGDSLFFSHRLGAGLAFSRMSQSLIDKISKEPESVYSTLALELNEVSGEPTSAENHSQKITRLLNQHYDGQGYSVDALACGGSRCVLSLKFDSFTQTEDLVEQLNAGRYCACRALEIMMPDTKQLVLTVIFPG